MTRKTPNGKETTIIVTITVVNTIGITIEIIIIGIIIIGRAIIIATNATVPHDTKVREMVRNNDTMSPSIVIPTGGAIISEKTVTGKKTATRMTQLSVI